MAIKTILSYADASPGTGHRLAAAIETARQMDAHLTVLAFGFQPDIPPFVDGMGAGTLAMPPDASRAESEEHARMARELIARAGIRGEAIPTVCLFGTFAREFGEAAQFSDLVVLGRPYGEGAGSTADTALEGALFDGDAAVLVYPDNVEHLDAKSVLIAWNGSREALRAVRRAMPLLASAERVEIAIFGSTPSEPMPGQRLATMLSRQGIQAEVTAQPREDDVTSTLRRRVVETGANLVVLGAYSHSRFREYVIGGVTRDYLADFATPVLMAH